MLAGSSYNVLSFANVHVAFTVSSLLLRVRMDWLGFLVRADPRGSREREEEEAHRGRKVFLVITDFLGRLVLRERKGRKVPGGLRVPQGEMGLMGQRESKEKLAHLGVRANPEQR